MSMAVPISPVGPVAAATMVFRDNGLLQVTAIVKATFALPRHGHMALAQPEPIFTREAHRMNNPTRSIVATSDLVPRMPAAEVLLVGHAHAPGGSATHVVVRLVVGRGNTTILDKSVHVVGDRKGSEIKPFRTMPLAYEKAYGGPGYRDNPLGTGVLTGDAPPNLVDPAGADRAIGFGPISRSWPSRSSLVSPEMRAALDRPIAELGPGFDLRYFHAAPPDQRVSHLLGDEWFVIENAHSDAPKIHVALPGAQAQTRIVGGEADGRVFSLRADTLRIDTDAERCTLVWRNSFPVRESDLGAFRLLAGVALPDVPVAWPLHAALEQVPAGAPIHQYPPRDGATMVLSDEPALASTFSGTIEVADDDIEPIQVDVKLPDPINTTMAPRPDAASASALPAFMNRRPAPPPPAPPARSSAPPSPPSAPAAPPPVAPAVRPSAPRARDPKEATMDLSNFVASGRAVMPFAGKAGAPGDEPGAAPPSAPKSSNPIPNSPWDPDRRAGLPLEEAATFDTGSLDLAGTLVPHRPPEERPFWDKTAPLPEIVPLDEGPPATGLEPRTTPLPPPPALLGAPLTDSPPPPPAFLGAPLTDSPPVPPAFLGVPQTASPPAPPALLGVPQTASLPTPPPAPVAAAPPPPPPPPPAPPVTPVTPPVDPWGQALRQGAEPAAPAPQSPSPSRPIESAPSVRSALYKKFKKT